MKKQFLIAAILFTSLLYGQTERLLVSDDIEVSPISENILLYVSYLELPDYGKVPANSLLVKTDSGFVVIDTPWNNAQAEVLNNWIENEFKMKVVAVIATHFHADCAGGLGYFNNQVIPTYGLQLTKELCLRTKIPNPSHTFSDSLQLNFSGLIIDLYYPGPGHSEDNIVVWIEKEKTLFGGCLIKALSSSGMGNTADADIQKWPSSVKNVQRKYGNVEIVVPGHGAVGGTGLLAHTMKIFYPDNE